MNWNSTRVLRLLILLPVMYSVHMHAQVEFGYWAGNVNILTDSHEIAPTDVSHTLPNQLSKLEVSTRDGIVIVDYEIDKTYLLENLYKDNRGTTNRSWQFFVLIKLSVDGREIALNRNQIHGDHSDIIVDKKSLEREVVVTGLLSEQKFISGLLEVMISIRYERRPCGQKPKIRPWEYAVAGAGLATGAGLMLFAKHEHKRAEDVYNEYLESVSRDYRENRYAKYEDLQSNARTLNTVGIVLLSLDAGFILYRYIRFDRKNGNYKQCKQPLSKSATNSISASLTVSASGIGVAIPINSP